METTLVWVERSVHGGTVVCADVALRLVFEVNDYDTHLCGWAYLEGPHALKEQNPGALDYVTKERVQTAFEKLWTATPVVGMGATYLGWTDRHPYTIISVSKTGKTIEVQEDIATRVDTNGMSEAQAYTFEANPGGTVHKLRLAKDGKWRVLGDGKLFAIGYRSRYHDYGF